nr:hypothetical protein Iba_chr08fCG1770 [Ipomoea batatas]
MGATRIILIYRRNHNKDCDCLYLDVAEEAIGGRRKCCPSPEGFAAAITAETTTVPNRKLPPTSITIRLHPSADRKPPQPPPKAFADPTRRSLVCTYLWFADQHPLALGIKSGHLSYSQRRVYEVHATILS